MNYYLRGSDGDFSGLGAIATPVYENCNPSDSACVARNQLLNAAYNEAVVQDLWKTYNSGPMPVGWMTAGDDPIRQQQVAADYNTANPVPVSTPAASAPAASGGHVTFTSSRGSNALQVGDTWLVSITGATPNAQVTVNAGGATTPMGTTDANGNFSLAGTARAADIGSWNELWSVGNLASGAFQFTISAPPTAATPPSAAPPVTPPATPLAAGTSTGSASGASVSSTVIGGFDLSTIPIWAWAGAAAVALLAFGGGGRGR
jgi:hypothetical protein